MNLNLLERDFFNTVFTHPETGQPLYYVETPFKMFGRATTTIKKIQGPNSFDMARVASRAGLLSSPSMVEIGGRDFTPHRDGMFSQTQKFMASNNQLYKWKNNYGDFSLVRSGDSSKTPLAIYDSGSHGIFSKSRPASLQLSQEVIPIMDEVVATFLYMQHEKIRRRRNGAAAGGAAGASGGGGC